jgi:hypothetical protein
LTFSLPFFPYLIEQEQFCCHFFGFVLGCFFGLGLKMFAGCVQGSTRKHKKAQKSKLKHTKGKEVFFCVQRFGR